MARTAAALPEQQIDRPLVLTLLAGITVEKMRKKKLVAVSVGTDHHPFDRLVAWTGEWAKENSDVQVVIQRGPAAAVPGLDCPQVMPHDELRRLFGIASVVVCHGGPSTVMDARYAGSKPIVLPRNPEFGEHVDGHQLAFAHHLERHALAKVVYDRGPLFEAIEAGIADEGLYRTVHGHGLEGVVGFGQMLDNLLGTVTEIDESGEFFAEETSPINRHEEVSAEPARPAVEG